MSTSVYDRLMEGEPYRILHNHTIGTGAFGVVSMFFFFFFLILFWLLFENFMIGLDSYTEIVKKDIEYLLFPNIIWKF